MKTLPILTISQPKKHETIMVRIVVLQCFTQYPCVPENIWKIVWSRNALANLALRRNSPRQRGRFEGSTLTPVQRVLDLADSRLGVTSAEAG